MGNRHRVAEKKRHRELLLKLGEDDKRFSRAKADAELSAGANPAEDRFVKHQNYHIRQRAWKLRGKPVPEGQEAQKDLMENLHLKSLD